MFIKFFKFQLIIMKYELLIIIKLYRSIIKFCFSYSYETKDFFILKRLGFHVNENFHLYIFHTIVTVALYFLSSSLLSEFHSLIYPHKFNIVNFYIHDRAQERKKSSPTAFIRISFDKWCWIILQCVNIPTNIRTECICIRISCLIVTHRASREKAELHLLGMEWW